ncbi:MAG: 2,3,4,5-tetrahydropyridine-2,6-dicarboxylate N-succinyltransferase, partial [Sphingomonadaceae bacterium]|nr:2,3,4,5-tetrahydropyridine-2,6-dicarboxylate N-succinyltransferase [Sphingomonadaceae bacterium]
MSPEAAIAAAWDDRASLSPATGRAVRDAVDAAIAGLDDGTYRVAEPDGAGGWRVNQWLKQAVLLSFRLNDNAVMDTGRAWDKVPLKWAGWD